MRADQRHVVRSGASVRSGVRADGWAGRPLLGHDRSCAGGAEPVHGARVCCRITCSRSGSRCGGRCSCPRRGRVLAGASARCRATSTRSCKHEAIFTEHFADARASPTTSPSRSATTTPRTRRSSTPTRCSTTAVPSSSDGRSSSGRPTSIAHAVIGRWTLEKVAVATAIPMELIWQNLARNVPPKDLNTDAGMLEVLPDVDVSYDPARPFRIVVIAHIFYDEMTDEMLDLRRHACPGAYDLVVTTPGRRPKADAIRRIDRRRDHARVAPSRCASLPSNDGRDQSAFLIACRDVLLGDRYDLVVKLHSKKTPQDGFNVGRHFKEQQFDNLLNSARLRRQCPRALPDGARTRTRLSADDPHRLPDDGPRRGGRTRPGSKRSRTSSASTCRSTRSRRSRPTDRCTSRGPESLRLLVEHEWTLRPVRRGGGLPRRRARAHPRADAVIRGRRARLPHAHRLDVRVHVDQPHGVRVQARRDVRRRSPATATRRSTSSARRASWDTGARGTLAAHVHAPATTRTRSIGCVGSMDPARLSGRWIRRLRHADRALLHEARGQEHCMNRDGYSCRVVWKT